MLFVPKTMTTTMPSPPLPSPCSPTLPPLISRLPNELLYTVVQLLDIEDAFVLGQSCRYFRDVIHDNSISRVLVEKHAPFSDECARMRPAWRYASALRILAKRRLAIANLEPFAAVVLAAADVPTHGPTHGPAHGSGYARSHGAPLPPSYVYAGQTLLYMAGRGTLRILPLHSGSTVHHETTVHVRALLDQAVPASKGTRRYSFRPLHYADGIVSCVYAQRRVGPGAPGGQESWLVLFNPVTRWSTSCRLGLPHHRLFVRNNKDYLVYGTYTGRRLPQDGGGAVGQADMGGPGRHRRWALWRYSFLDHTWSPKAILLDDVIGLADLGSSLCFEVIDGYFYALANQQRYLDDDDEAAEENNGNNDSEDGDNDGDNDDDYVDADGERHQNGTQRSRATGIFAPASYYTCLRFPLSDPHRRETPTRASLWRRRNDEGAVDDRWTTLRLEKSAATGRIVVVESRKEWLRVSGGTGSSSSSRRTYYMQTLDWGGGDGNSLESGCCSPQPHRRPEQVHPGDDAARMMPLTLSECAARVYSTTSTTFLDLYDQPAPDAPATQRLVLRAGARTARAPTLAPAPSSSSSSSEACEDDNPLYPLQEINRCYVDRDVVTWPATKATTVGGVGGSNNSDDARELDLVLNPPGYYGNVTATWDDRLLIYSTGCSNSGSNSMTGTAEANSNHDKQAIVLVSFDPTLRLPGLKVWEEGKDVPGRNEGTLPTCLSPGVGSGVGEGEGQSQASGYSSSSSPETARHKGGQKEGGGLERGHKLDETLATPELAAQGLSGYQGPHAQAQDDVSLSTKLSLNVSTNTSWASSTEPMYRRINRGFDFTYHKEEGNSP